MRVGGKCMYSLGSSWQKCDISSETSFVECMVMLIIIS